MRNDLFSDFVYASDKPDASHVMVSYSSGDKRIRVLTFEVCTNDQEQRSIALLTVDDAQELAALLLDKIDLALRDQGDAP